MSSDRFNIDIRHESILDLARRGESFAFKTTLAGKAYARKITEWRRQGYEVSINFLKLSSCDLAIDRVAARASQGGHNVVEDVIRHRVAAGRRNFKDIYRDIVDSWIVYENSGSEPIRRRPVSADGDIGALISVDDDGMTMVRTESDDFPIGREFRT